MENQPSGPLEVLPAQPKPKLPKLPLLILGLVLLILTAEGVYFFRLQKQKKLLELPKEIAVKKLLPTQAVARETKVTDLFNSPVFEMPMGEASSDGRSYTLYSYEDPEIRWINQQFLGLLAVEGDFEIRFRVALGEERTGGIFNEAALHLLNRLKIQESDNVTIIFEKGPGIFSLSSFKRDADKLPNPLGKASLPSSGKMIFRFENVGSSEGEAMIVLDGDSQKELLKAQLHFPFFVEDSQLGFGFDVGNGLKSMTISDFQIVSLGGSLRRLR